ncbi:phage baseplate assembly protein V [Glaciimonas sp. GG7]
MLPARIPGIVHSYDAAARECRVDIPGLTDGADVLPLAEIEYPIGDKSKTGTHATEIEIVPGDLVWLAFEGGDPRYPIITGFRNPRSGNAIDWRRWHHANIELTADGIFRVNCTRYEINASEMVDVTTPQATFSENVTATGLLTYQGGMAGSGGAGGASANIQGGIENTGGDIVSNGIGVQSHHHTEHDGPSTGSANP